MMITMTMKMTAVYERVDNLTQFDWESHDENNNYNGCQEFSLG